MADLPFASEASEAGFRRVRQAVSTRNRPAGLDRRRSVTRLTRRMNGQDSPVEFQFASTGPPLMRLTPAFAALAIASAVAAPALAETTYLSRQTGLSTRQMEKVIRNAAFMITDGKSHGQRHEIHPEAPKSGTSSNSAAARR
jgi:hypothetical protein